MFALIICLFPISLCDIEQGQASDIMIRAQEINRMKQILSNLYVKHTGRSLATVGKCRCVPLPSSTLSYCELCTVAMDVPPHEYTT